MRSDRLARLLFDWISDGVMLREGTIGVVQLVINIGERYLIKFQQLPQAVVLAADLIEIIDGDRPEISQEGKNPC